jgi:hypothetical protein
MASIEGRPRPSLLFHRKKNKLESAKPPATRTSTPRSKVKDEVLLSATATATPTTASGSALENYMRLLEPTKTSNRILKNDMIVPTRRETSTRTLEIKDDVLIPATAITTPPVVISDSPHFLFRLPRELGDCIYAYLAPDEAFWIARPPVVGKKQNAVVEKASMHKSAALIKCKHSLIFASRDTRDEFRCALWRDYVDSDRQVPLRVYDFDPKPVRDLFHGCSTLDLPKVLQKGRYRVNMYLTGDLRRFRKVAQFDLRSLIKTLIMRWVEFCDENRLHPIYSFSKCTWIDMAVVDVAISQSDFEAGPEDWDEIQTDPHFVRLVPFIRRWFGRLLLGGDLDRYHQDRLIERKWEF